MTDTTTTPRHDSSVTRRTALTALTGTLTTLAGCAGKATDDSTSKNTETAVGSPAEQSDVFTDIRFDDGTLVAAVSANPDAQWVRREGPTGVIQKARVSEGGEAYLDLVGSTTSGYIPGTHELTAIENDNILGKIELGLTPSVGLSDFRWAKNHPDLGWEKEKRNWERYSALILQNTGSAPTAISVLRWRKTPRLLMQLSHSRTVQRQVILPPGETVIVYSRWPTFETQSSVGSGLDCRELGTIPFTVTIDLQVGSNISYSQPVTYNGDQYSCELSLGEGSSRKVTSTTSS